MREAQGVQSEQLKEGMASAAPAAALNVEIGVFKKVFGKVASGIESAQCRQLFAH